MEGWTPFLFMTGSLLLFALLMWLGDRGDDRRWKQQREAQEEARRAAAE
jgi:hypothetical protein